MTWGEYTIRVLAKNDDPMHEDMSDIPIITDEQVEDDDGDSDVDAFS
jgi:hypothetical protein